MSAIAAPAAADIPTQIVRGDVGVSYEYDYGNGYTPSISYPYRVTASSGARAVAYCVEWPIGTDVGVEYSEGAWNGIADLTHVNWILQHSAPVVANDALTDAVEDHSGLTLGDYSDYEARGVTQWAVWHYTDGFDIAQVSPTNLFEQVGGGGIKAALDLTRLTALYDYLTDPAVNVGLAEPSVSLALDASSAAWDGELYGPIRFITGAPEVELSVVSGSATVVDSTGSPIDRASADDEVFLHSPSGSTGTATLSATAPLAALATGTLLLSPGQQTLMVADQLNAAADTTLEVVLAPQPKHDKPPKKHDTPPKKKHKPAPPTDDARLADTGSSTQFAIWAGAGALALIGGALLAHGARRRAVR